MAMKSKVVELKRMDRREVVIPIVGTSPLITHKFSEKAKRQMLDKQMKKASPGREAKNPQEQYEGAMYVLPSFAKSKAKRYGFPVDGIKQSMVRAGKALGMVMVDSKGAFFVEGEYSPEDGRDMIEILGEPEMREDVVRIQNTCDIRFRPQFFPWSANIRIDYNASVISEEQLLNMLDSAGFSVGLGEWRPEKDGTMGRFKVETA